MGDGDHHGFWINIFQLLVLNSEVYILKLLNYRSHKFICYHTQWPEWFPNQKLTCNESVIGNLLVFFSLLKAYDATLLTSKIFLGSFQISTIPWQRSGQKITFDKTNPLVQLVNADSPQTQGNPSYPPQSYPPVIRVNKALLRETNG